MTLIATHPESVAATAWSPADEQFFRVTRDLFQPSYLLGATVLLASYDDDSLLDLPTSSTPPRGAPAHETSHQTAASAA